MIMRSNLKAELEIMLLHEKVDLLREGQWSELLVIQKEQLKLLGDLTAKNVVAERVPVLSDRSQIAESGE